MTEEINKLMELYNQESELRAQRDKAKSLLDYIDKKIHANRQKMHQLGYETQGETIYGEVFNEKRVFKSINDLYEKINKREEESS